MNYEIGRYGNELGLSNTRCNCNPADCSLFPCAVIMRMHVQCLHTLHAFSIRPLPLEHMLRLAYYRFRILPMPARFCLMKRVRYSTTDEPWGRIPLRSLFPSPLSANLPPLPSSPPPSRLSLIFGRVITPKWIPMTPQLPQGNQFNIQPQLANFDSVFCDSFFR